MDPSSAEVVRVLLVDGPLGGREVPWTAGVGQTLVNTKSGSHRYVLSKTRPRAYHVPDDIDDWDTDRKWAWVGELEELDTREEWRRERREQLSEMFAVDV